MTKQAGGSEVGNCESGGARSQEQAISPTNAPDVSRLFMRPTLVEVVRSDSETLVMLESPSLTLCCMCSTHGEVSGRGFSNITLENTTSLIKAGNILHNSCTRVSLTTAAHSEPHNQQPQKIRLQPIRG